jgi:hypothetical protein
VVSTGGEIRSAWLREFKKDGLATEFKGKTPGRR